MENKKKADQTASHKLSNFHYNPKIEFAERFLRLLDSSSDHFTFQTFNEAPGGDTLALVLHGTLTDHAEQLVQLNLDGAGVFVTINETTLEGRRGNKNIVRVRAVFADTDGADLEPIQEALPPHIVVTTSPGNWHVYWRVSDLPLDDFKGVQQRIARQFGTDQAVNDLARVMRLPGFFHLKREPFLVDIVEARQ